MSKLDQIIQDIHNELGADVHYIEIVGSDGLSIADAHYVNVDTSAISARFSLVARLASKVADKLDLGEVEDNLITLNNAASLMHMLGDGSYFAIIGLAKDAPLGVVRMMLKDYSEQLWDAIPR
ncbi:MAG: roadblock/LC7 domain-containing protein [Anaerolineaceae bacterium]